MIDQITQLDNEPVGGDGMFEGMQIAMHIADDTQPPASGQCRQIRNGCETVGAARDRFVLSF
ncbi:hypothetical protein AA101099_1197 [Neoasaia chiangmaiensis NBRC 101099]|nr:hypothetical protein AA101099_1197 [Neoasaia chiangmaiensis NBRC 101099]